MIDLTWVLALFGLWGMILNIQGSKKWCFFLWFWTDLIWGIIDFKAGIPAQGTLLFVCCGVSIWGFIKYNNLERRK